VDGGAGLKEAVETGDKRMAVGERRGRRGGAKAWLRG
jgi:hypothetical protein